MACLGVCLGLPFGGCRGIPWVAALVGLVEGCRGMPMGTTNEVSGIPWPALVCCGMPWPALGGVVACYGLPWWIPWLALGVPSHAMADLGGCHSMPWWAPWHVITLQPMPRCIFSFGNDPNCALKFFIGHLECVPCFNFH
jgi:hypothetical protein